MRSRQSFGLSLFLSAFAAAVLCMAGADLCGLELTRARSGILLGLGSLSFVGFLVWLDAAADECNERRARR